MFSLFSYIKENNLKLELPQVWSGIKIFHIMDNW